MKQQLKDHWIIALISTAAAIAGIFGVLHSLTPDPVERPLAVRYLEHYYGAVTRNPRSCCFDELDSTYQSLHPNHTLSDYVAFFRQFNQIDVAHVRDAPDGYFKAQITYHYRDGRSPATETDWFKLVCPEKSELPRVGCDVGDVSVDDVTNKYR